MNIQIDKGSQHDLKLAEKHIKKLCHYSTVLADKGYQGLAKLGLQTPKKKSKHRPLSREDKVANSLIGKTRIVIEHINRRLKVFKILALPYRNRRKRFGLRTNLIAGLVNEML